MGSIIIVNREYSFQKHREVPVEEAAARSSCLSPREALRLRVDFDC